MAPARALLINNYDSYAEILAHVIARCEGAMPWVIKNDEVHFSELRAALRTTVTRVVIGPGPGTPGRASDLGVGDALVRSNAAEAREMPIFGVCLGHQALAALAAGGVAERNPRGAVHGRVCGVRHDGESALFDGVPSGGDAGFVATRYHSLAVTACGEEYRARAWAEDDGTIMAIDHRELPRFGVQFHPESVSTTYGDKIYANFMAISDRWWKTRGRAPPSGEAIPRSLGAADEPTTRASIPMTARSRVRLEFNSLDVASSSAFTTEGIFWSLFGGVEGDAGDVARDCFWLDSADESKGRFSFMGARGGSMWRRVRYNLASAPERDADTVEDNGKVCWRVGGASTRRRAAGSIEIFDGEASTTTTLERGFVSWLDDELQRRTLNESDAAALPFDFQGGFVGYLGYELRDECDSLPPKYDSPLPDAAFFLADRFVAFDHVERQAYIVGVYEEDDARGRDATQSWVAATTREVSRLATETVEASDSPPTTSPPMSSTELLEKTGFTWRRDRDEYISDIKASQDAIEAGETYEVCLTNMLRRTGSRAEPRRLYSELRRSNAAPYAALLSIGGDEHPLVISCCSPERFLRHTTEGALEAKPIKGTCKRLEPLGGAADRAAALALERNVKDRAENLMIVDLLRNDLARVCDVGTVEVPGLMQIESYATVHQLVSTVRGRRRDDVTPMHVVRATYPGGSMTGAPKIRTMEIIDALETGPRMVYSGSIGFFSLSRAFDLNIVIRSVLSRGDEQWIGAGGAITILSDPVSEWEEIELKASAILRAVARVDP